jgi:hypothetical protein
MVQIAFMQELRTGHTLMMQCAATAERLLGYDQPAGSPAPHARAEEEAARMAGLFARLGEGYGRAALLQHRLSAAALDKAVPSSAPASPAPSASAPKLHAIPGAARGRLKNGNPSVDYLKSPRCGACTRAGGCCRQPAMANGRCRMHGGLSTGPRTPEGLARCRTTRLVHGCRTRAHLALRSRAVHAARRLRALTTGLSARVSAGHGVHRPDSLSAPVGAAPRGRPLPPTIVAKRGAHVGAPLRKEPSATAGHGVHRSDSINRTDAEPALGPAKGRTRGAQRDRVAESRPHSPSFSASPRLCGESCQRKAPLSAGHGVHRSFRNHLCSSVFIRGSQTFQPNATPPAGHGVLRPDSPDVTTPAGLR